MTKTWDWTNTAHAERLMLVGKGGDRDNRRIGERVMGNKYKCSIVIASQVIQWF